ncbi:BatA domain-containing protein [Planctomicrobium sp. SH661]|uniref:BatA domain-containing protein n=1 Tax=Planctomicrobium sp. SH661 TaxID=3448124 RepID=UPI003F5C64C5
MGLGFLNVWMLIGLASVALPVAAHLISRRRYDVVQWGAMRFLELGQRTRNRIRLQDILLLLLRMGLLASLAVALSRPWGGNRLFGAFGAHVQQDLVFILDGSASMDWHEGVAGQPPQNRRDPQTPHLAAVQWIFDALEELSPGDTAGLIDARNQPRRLVSPPASDFKAVRDKLTRIAAPAGTSQLPEAIEEALKVLATSSNVSRRVVVLTDDQSLAWRPGDELAWTRVDELRKQTQVVPAIDVVTLGASERPRTNFSVGRIELSRQVTVPEFPIKIRAMIRQSGGTAPARRKASLSVDGQQIPGKTTEVDLLPDGEALVEFDHAFPAEGNFIASIVLEEADQLPNDDHAEAIIVIASSIPVLLVDGDRHVDPTRSETFYIQSVFAASGSESPWIKARVISPHELDDSLLLDQQAVFLCNVEKLTQRQWELLRRYVRDGGGLVIAPGEKVNVAQWNAVDQNEKVPFLPAKFSELVQGKADSPSPEVTLDSSSLEVPWLQRFREENGVDLARSRFSRWWRLEPVRSPAASADDSKKTSDDSRPVRAIARLAQGDPWLLQRDYGHGSVIEMATPLDADWSTLPAKSDFVPFLHELVFALTSSGQRRNVDVGSPLLLALKAGENASDYFVSGPGFSDEPAVAAQRGRNFFAEFRQTSTPGLYRFQKKNDRASAAQPFVVDDDHRESNLASLTEQDWATLTSDGRMQRVKTMRDINAAAAGQGPRVELWWVLLLLVLAMLICEVALTRRMVQGGHAVLDESLT